MDTYTKEITGKSIHLQSGLRRLLQTISIRGVDVDIWVFSDDQPEIKKAYQLWQEVYVEEYKYNAPYITDVAVHGHPPISKGGLFS